MDHVMNDRYHDYDTLVHAIASCALAAAYAANQMSGVNGVISGLMKPGVMWDFIKQWLYRGNKTGMRLLNYDNLLFPQYAHNFEKTISPDVWEALQKEARLQIEKNLYYVHPDVKAHWESIANGNLPFGFTIRDD